MSLKKKPEEESFGRFPTSKEFYDRNIDIPAKKLKEIIEDTTGKYKAEYNHTPPGMRWTTKCVSKGDWGYSRSVYKRELEEMPKRKKRNTFKHNKVIAQEITDDSSSVESDDSAV